MRHGRTPGTQRALHLARQLCSNRQFKQLRLVDQHDDLPQTGGGMHVHRLAGHRRRQTAKIHLLPGKLDRRSADRQSQPKPPAQQLTAEVRPQRIIFVVGKNPAGRDEIDLTTRLPRLQLHGLQVEKVPHGSRHALDPFAFDHAAQDRARCLGELRILHTATYSHSPRRSQESSPA